MNDSTLCFIGAIVFVLFSLLIWWASRVDARAMKRAEKHDEDCWEQLVAMGGQIKLARTAEDLDAAVKAVDEWHLTEPVDRRKYAHLLDYLRGYASGRRSVLFPDA